MTVAQLIEELAKMPPHAPVCINAEGEDDDGVSIRALVDAQGVRWQGNHVEIE